MTRSTDFSDTDVDAVEYARSVADLAMEDGARHLGFGELSDWDAQGQLGYVTTVSLGGNRWGEERLDVYRFEDSYVGLAFVDYSGDVEGDPDFRVVPVREFQTTSYEIIE